MASNILMDFSALGNLPRDYYQHQQMRDEKSSRDSLKGTPPIGPDGDVDFGALAKRKLAAGDLPGFVQLRTLAIEQEKVKQGNRDSEALVAGFGTPQPPATAPAGPSLAPTSAVPEPAARDLAIRTMIGEAANQGPEGLAAVAHTIQNRLKAGTFGKDIPNIVLARNQFEPWQTRRGELEKIDPNSSQYQMAAKIYDDVIGGRIPDPTKGATHFLNPEIVMQRSGRLPPWAQGDGTKIGQHTFYNPQPTAAAPVASASPGPVAPTLGPTGAPAPALAGVPIQQQVQLLIRAATRPGGSPEVKQAALAILKSTLDKMDLPPKVKEYVYAQGQGFKGTLQEWDRLPEEEKRKSAELKSAIDVREGAEKEIFSGVNKRLGETYEKGVSTIKDIDAIHQMRMAMDSDSGIVTGLLANQRLTIRRIATMFGVDDAKVQNTQGLMASVAQRVFSTIKNLGSGSGITDTDREFARQAAGGELTFDEKAIRKILDIGEKSNRKSLVSHNAQVEKALGVEPALAKYKPGLILEMPGEYTSPKKAGQPATPVRSKQEYDALAPGTTFVGLDGKEYMKP